MHALSLFIAQAELAKVAVDPLAQWMPPAVTVVLMLVFGLLWRRAEARAAEKRESDDHARFAKLELQVTAMAAAVAPLPDFLDRFKRHEVEMERVKQEQRDATLVARQYVTRSELVESLGSTGEKVHKRVDAVEKEITRLDERSKARRRT